MTEDYQVKQSTSGSGGYGLTGTVLGAGGAYWAANKYTKPKYGSYEDLINESKDKFDKKVTNAPEVDKKFLSNVKEIRNIIDASNEEYNNRVAQLKTDKKLTEKEAEELVNKEFNVKNKAEYINNKIKEQSEKLLKEYGEKFKRKWGFEGNTKLKLVGAAIAGAIVLGGIFSSFTPKRGISN